MRKQTRAQQEYITCPNCKKRMEKYHKSHYGEYVLKSYLRKYCSRKCMAEFRSKNKGKPVNQTEKGAFYRSLLEKEKRFKNTLKRRVRFEGDQVL